MIVKGPFEVKLAPADFHGEGANCGRMTIDKTFTGDLDATSTGEMLSSMGNSDGNAGYVAIERVEGTLSSKAGGFSLMHFGRMDAGADSLRCEIVADSGTGELAGISGECKIIMEDDGSHFYELNYEV